MRRPRNTTEQLTGTSYVLKTWKVPAVDME